MTDIPEPENSGSAGTQTSASTEVVSVTQEGTLESLPITRVVEGLAATRSRSMGGEVAAGLLAGTFTQISHELSEAKTDLGSTRQELRLAEQSLSELKSRNAVLEERVGTVRQYRHLSNIAIFAGTALIGLAIELHRNSYGTGAFISGILGLLLVLVGWLTPTKGVKQ